MAVWTGSVAIKLNFDLTILSMMERLPTETMVEVLEYSDKHTIHSFTIVSSKYSAITQPLLFRRISVDRMAYKRFTLFVEQMQKSSKLALMIKVLIIHKATFVVELPRLFAVVSNLEELLVEFTTANILLAPHYFPNLRRLRYPISNKKIINDLVANFIPRHEFLNNLEVPVVPEIVHDDPGILHMPLPAESASRWVSYLVTYHGPRGLLPLLTQNSRMKHLTSSEQLDEVTLRELSRAVSGGLLSLIIEDPMDQTVTQTLPVPLLPSLFPNLQSLAWLSVHIIHPEARVFADQIADTVGTAHMSCFHRLIN